MRESEKDPQRLRDILEAIDNVFKYVGDCDFNSFIDDAMRYHAVVYNKTEKSMQFLYSSSAL